MATLKGFGLKKLKSYEGMEGIAYQGDLYLNGKKIGFWSQDGNGAIEDRFEFNPEFSEDKFRNLIEKTNEAVGSYFGTVPMSAEVFMDRLLDLTLAEKEYRRAIKRGFGYCIRVEAECLYPEFYYIPEGMNKDEAADEVSRAYGKAYGGRSDDLKLTFYMSPEDFSVGIPYDVAHIRKEA